jgi:hypothetical protein
MNADNRILPWVCPEGLRRAQRRYGAIVNHDSESPISAETLLSPGINFKCTGIRDTSR